MTAKLFSDLGLSDEVLKAIDNLGFEQASPIQAAAIPLLMAGKDIVGQSQTGSGKTAAFGIPAVEKVDTALRAVQVLVLCPTRELAIQVSEEIHKLANFKRGVNTLPIYGGQSYERQFYGLKQGAQIVIGTPGRIMDHMRRGTLRLETVKLVVLDEADVMLNMGFRDDIETILKDAPKERQTVFFSATMPRPIRELIERYARDPENVSIEQKAMTVPTVEQVYYEVERRFKIELLTRLIDIHDLKLGIIFCNTKRMVDDLVDHLEAQGYMADRLHGDMTQAMRDRVMNKFRKSGLEFLVATDIAARGIDVDDVQVVFNYDLPYDGEDYVHRIGRTGRAGRAGRAISFASGREVFQIRNIERYTNTRIQRARVPTEAEVEEARDNVFLGKIRDQLHSGQFKSHESLIERLMEEGFSSTDVAAACLSLLLSGEGSTKPGVEQDDRPRREQSPERGNFREDRRGRQEDRGPRFERREPIERSQRLGDRPSRSATASTRPPVSAPQPAPEKTFSDKEILASVKGSEPKPPKLFSPKGAPPWANKKYDNAKPARKTSRATPANQTRLWMNLGEAMDIKPIDIVNAISGETGLPGKVVGAVDVRERHLFADVESEHARAIIAKLSRAQIKGHPVKVKIA
ncbi:MAG TPA: DEAD/DEAH box helicase [Verrucomicrobiae bacterium]|nr:DEAD/DEAH box helicase [Verrucomicrobiae bacterium]